MTAKVMIAIATVAALMAACGDTGNKPTPKVGAAKAAAVAASGVAKAPLRG